MKSYGAYGFAGCVQIRRNRETGTRVGVYNGEQAGLDTDDGRTPWSTICEDHGSICSHPTLALARDHAAEPSGWCEDCQAETDLASGDSYDDNPQGGWPPSTEDRTMIYRYADFYFENPIENEGEIEDLAETIGRDRGWTLDVDYGWLFGHNYVVTGIRVLRPNDPKLIADVVELATIDGALPDTAESAVSELRRLSDLLTDAGDHLGDDVWTEPDPNVPGVWKVETPEWIAVVYLAGYGGRTETDFETALTEPVR